jgi:hypothetical protein
MNLSQHIIELLKETDCVIVPDFGGFIANYVPANFDEAHHCILPPGKEIFFNPKINRNDGMLIQYVSESEGITYLQAKQYLQVFRDQAISNLYKGLPVVFEGLGSVQLNHTGAWLFVSSQPKLNTDTFGLPALTLSEKKFIEPTLSIRPQHPISLPKRKSEWVRVAASIALLVAFSLVPKPGEMPQRLQTSEINPFALLSDPLPNIESTATESNNETAETESIHSLEQTENQPYVLVGGSFAHIENARKLFNELQQKAHHPELYQLDNGWYRVTVDSYNSWKQALKAMELYRENNPGSNVWASKR